MSRDRFVWVRLRESTIATARAAMKILGMQLWDQSRVEPEKVRKDHLRAEGTHYMDREREIQAAEFAASEGKPPPWEDK